MNTEKLSDCLFTNISIENGKLISSIKDQPLLLSSYPDNYDSKFSTPIACLKATNQYKGDMIY